MAKWLVGMIRFFGVLLILAALGYNSLQVAALRAEVETLKKERANASASPGTEGIDGIDRAALDRVRRHVDRAQELLRSQDYAKARREIQAALSLIRQTTADVQTGGDDAFHGLKERMDGLSREIEALWERHGGAKAH